MATSDRRIWVISGPSSVGKTTLMESPRLGELIAPSSEYSVHIASAGPPPESGDLVVHYNIQRPLHQHLVRDRPEDRANLSAAALNFGSDPVWARLRSETGVHVIVLATELDRLHNRVLRRESIESPTEPYRVDHWRERFEALDVRIIYGAWLAELENHGIPFTLLTASDREFRQLGSAAELYALVDGRSPEWSPQRIEDWSDPNRFQYQRVPLPLGLSTAGTDRSATRDLIFRSPVADKSVLEVGSSEGYFCFEAEMRDAARVKGIEFKQDRYDLACQIKEIRGSDVEFEHRDLVTDPVTEEWDVVLLLNVIHHLPEPMRVLRNLAQCARERLVIEFPTFADPRFRSHRRIRMPWIYNRKPLIGVSSLVKGVAQTFVFSPPAIRAILLDLDTPIRKVDFEPSPLPGRVIAHAYR